MKNLKSEFFEYFKSLSESDLQQLAGVMPVFNPEGHQISKYNTAFLKFQNDNLKFTIIAGYKQWRKFGRNVRKGQHGHWIFIPSWTKTKKNENGKESVVEEFDRFLMVRVFDISQTFEVKDQVAQEEPVLSQVEDCDDACLYCKEFFPDPDDDKFDEIYQDDNLGGTGHGDISYSDADPGL